MKLWVKFWDFSVVAHYDILQYFILNVLLFVFKGTEVRGWFLLIFSYLLLRFWKFDDFYASNVNTNSCSDKLKNLDLVMFSLTFILNNYEARCIRVESDMTALSNLLKKWYRKEV